MFSPQESPTLRDQPSVVSAVGTRPVTGAHAAFRHGLSSTLVVQFGILALGAFTGTAAARLLGPQGRGELAAVLLWPSMLSIMASLGMNQAIVFHTGQRRFSFSEVWSASTLMGLAQSAALVAAGLVIVPVALHAYSPEVKRLAQIYVCSSPLLLLSGYPGSLLQGKLDLAAFNVIRLVAPLTYAAGLGVLILLGRASVATVLACQIVGLALMLGGAYAVLVRKVKLHFTLRRGALKSLASYGWKTQLASISSYINQRVDQLVLSLFVAPQELGLYVVAVTVSTSLGFLPQASAIVTLASGANLARGDARAVIGRAFRFSLLWLFVASAVLFAVAPWLITLAFGARFAGSTLACRILLPGTVALGLNQVLYDGARALDAPSLPSYAEGAAAVLTCVGLLLLLPSLGFVGAAIASTAAYTTSLGVMLVLYRSRLGFGLRELLSPCTGLLAKGDLQLRLGSEAAGS